MKAQTYKATDGTTWLIYPNNCGGLPASVDWIGQDQDDEERNHYASSPEYVISDIENEIEDNYEDDQDWRRDLD